MKLPLLLTGGLGFIGQHLAWTLLNQGETIFCLDNLETGWGTPLPAWTYPLLEHPHFHWIKGDILDPICLQALPHVRGILHLAARAGVRDSLAWPERYFRTNRDGTQHLLEWASIRRVHHFLLASSSSVYGTQQSQPWSEDLPAAPISPYAQSKVQAEAWVKYYHQTQNLNAVSLRFFTVYGPGQRPDMGIYTFLTHLFAGKPLPLFAPAINQRDYTYIQDIVDGILKAWEWLENRPFAGYQVFNLGSGRPLGLNQFITQLAQALACPVQVDVLPPAKGDAISTWADIRQAQLAFGYQVNTALEEGLQSLANWFMDWQRKDR